MFGGAVYLNSIKSILPNSFNTAPYERFIVNHTYSFLNDSGSVDIKSTALADNTTATVMRPKFDAWMVEEAKKEGVYFAPKTLVKKINIQKRFCYRGKNRAGEVFLHLLLS